MIETIRVGKTRNLLRASSSLLEIWTRSAHHHPGQRRHVSRTNRPDKSTHSITSPDDQKILANRAASTKEGWISDPSPPPISHACSKEKILQNPRLSGDFGLILGQMPLDLLHRVLHSRLHRGQPGGSTAMGITKRGRTFYLRKRRPARYAPVEPRETIWISLHTDSESVARSKADRAWAQMIEAWEARLAGNSTDAEARYEAARDLARARGFRYLDAGAVAKLPLEDVVERVEAIPALANQPDAVEAAALLGTVSEPHIKV